MKQLLFTCFVLFLTFAGLAQVSVTFNDTLRPFGEGAYENRTVCADDSFYYIGGVFINHVSGGVNHFYINKLNKQGVLVDKMLYLDTLNIINNFPYHSMIVDGNRIITCFVIEDTSQIERTFVMAISKLSLDTLWTRYYPHPDTSSIHSSADNWSTLTAIKPVTGNDYILGGNYIKAGSLRSYIMKIDYTGNMLWIKKYDDVTYVFDIELTDDDGFSFLNNFGYQLNKIVFTDSLGNIIRNKLISTGSTGYTKTSSIARNNNGDYIGIDTYLYDSNPDFRYGLNVYKYDFLTDQVEWDKKFVIYNSIRCITLHQAIGVETLPDGKIIVSGTLSLNSGYRKGFVLKLNENGDSLWTRTYDLADQSSHHSQINDLMPTSEGGYIGVGFVRDINGDHTAWMFKTDSNGLITDMDSPNLPKIQVQVDCYPNPARSQLTLEWHSPTPQNGILEVYNPLGSLILQEEIRSSKHKLNLHTWQAGVYLYRLILDGEVLGAGKFVKEP